MKKAVFSYRLLFIYDICLVFAVVSCYIFVLHGVDKIRNFMTFCSIFLFLCAVFKKSGSGYDHANLSRETPFCICSSERGA